MIEELALKAGYIPFQFTSMDTLRRFADLVREDCAKTVEQAGIEGYGTLAAAAMIRARGGCQG